MTPAPKQLSHKYDAALRYAKRQDEIEAQKQQERQHLEMQMRMAWLQKFPDHTASQLELAELVRKQDPADLQTPLKLVADVLERGSNSTSLQSHLQAASFLLDTLADLRSRALSGEQTPDPKKVIELLGQVADRISRCEIQYADFYTLGREMETLARNFYQRRVDPADGSPMSEEEPLLSGMRMADGMELERFARERILVPAARRALDSYAQAHPDPAGQTAIVRGCFEWMGAYNRPEEQRNLQTPAYEDYKTDPLMNLLLDRVGAAMGRIGEAPIDSEAYGRERSALIGVLEEFSGQSLGNFREALAGKPPDLEPESELARYVFKRLGVKGPAGLLWETMSGGAERP